MGSWSNGRERTAGRDRLATTGADRVETVGSDRATTDGSNRVETRSATTREPAVPSVVLSIDAELAWGYHDLHPLSEEERRRVTNARRSWQRLLDLCDEYDVAATWAIVAHLLTDDGDALRARHAADDDWFEPYRRRSTNDRDRWVGADLVDAIDDAAADHEIGSHGFSHVVFDDASREIAAAELQLGRELMERHGLSPTSFVFPRNAVAHRSLLADHGFSCYRGRAETSAPGVRGGALLATFLTGVGGPRIVRPRVDEYGLVNVPPSLFVGGFRDPPWSMLTPLRGDPAVKLTELGLDQLDDPDDVLHLWLHPNDLFDEAGLDRMRELLATIADWRDRGAVVVETMGEVADRVLKNADGVAASTASRAVRRHP